MSNLSTYDTCKGVRNSTSRVCGSRRNTELRKNDWTSIVRLIFERTLPVMSCGAFLVELKNLTSGLCKSCCITLSIHSSPNLKSLLSTAVDFYHMSCIYMYVKFAHDHRSVWVIPPRLQIVRQLFHKFRRSFFCSVVTIYFHA